MSRAANSLKTSDVITTPIKLKYTSSYDCSTLGEYGMEVLTGVNGPVTITGSISQETINYYSVKHLYYSNYLTGSYPVSASSADNFLQSTAASGTLDADIRYFPTESGARITVLSIPRGVFGQQISRHGFIMSSSAYYLVDDGNGNIIDQAASNTHVGNIIYPQGMVIFTNPDYLDIVACPTTTTTSTTTSTTTEPTTTSTTTTTTTAAPTTTTTSTTTTTTTEEPTTTTSTTTTTTTEEPTTTTTTTSTTTTTTTEEPTTTTSTTTTTTTEPPTTTTTSTTTTTTTTDKVSIYINNTNSLDIPITGMTINGVAVTYESGTDFTITAGNNGNFTSTQTGTQTVVITYGSHISGQNIVFTDSNSNITCKDLNGSAGSFTIPSSVITAGTTIYVTATDGACA